MNRKVSPMNRNGNNQETMNQLRERYKRIRCKRMPEFDSPRVRESSKQNMIAFHMTQTRIAKDLGLFEDACRSVRDVQLPTFSSTTKTQRRHANPSTLPSIVNSFIPISIPLSIFLPPTIRTCVRLSPSFYCPSIDTCRFKFV